MTQVDSLETIIIQKIKQQGPIPFHDYMEMALYYPQLGYYTSLRNKIGTSGDYYTSPHFNLLFGAMIGNQLEEMWQVMGCKEFYIIEYGAGTGCLCRDILSRLKQSPEMYANIHYCIIEKSPAMQKMQQLLLPEKVSWHTSIDELKGVNGCVIANEVLDNFAVHEVIMQDELAEVFVDYKDGFTELTCIAPQQVANHFAELNVRLPKGFRTEVNMEATKWIEHITNALNKAFVIAIDYGFLSHEYYSGNRNLGTLMCYRNHQINTNVYHQPGTQDITAHVNFSALKHWAIKSGMQCCGYTTQANFLTALGLVSYLRVLERVNSGYKTQQAITLMEKFLMGMGKRLKVMVLEKGTTATKLSGLATASPID